MARSRLDVFTLVLLAPIAVGCGPAIDAETAAAEGRSLKPIHVEAPGPASVIGAAFAEVPLDPSQRRAIEQIAADTAARHRQVGAAMRAASAALADQIEAGEVDRAAMHEHVDAVADAWSRSQPADRANVQRLHGMLDIEQRQILADAIADRVEQRMPRQMIWAKWKTWKEELALTDAQEDAIADAVRARVKIPWWEHAHHRRMDEKVEDVLEAFVEEGFVLDAEAPPLDPHAVVAARAARVLDVVEAALPHLTPEQRAIAAKRIRRRGDEDMP